MLAIGAATQGGVLQHLGDDTQTLALLPGSPAAVAPPVSSPHGRGGRRGRCGALRGCRVARLPSAGRRPGGREAPSGWGDADGQAGGAGRLVALHGSCVWFAWEAQGRLRRVDRQHTAAYAASRAALLWYRWQRPAAASGRTGCVVQVFRQECGCCCCCYSTQRRGCSFTLE